MNANSQSSSKQGSALKRNSLATVCLSSCHKLLEQISDIKQSLLAKHGVALNGQKQILHSALTEAEALAWQTPYPHLFFPVLAEEKVRAARRWVARQEMVRRAGWNSVMAA